MNSFYLYKFKRNKHHNITILNKYNTSYLYNTPLSIPMSYRFYDSIILTTLNRMITIIIIAINAFHINVIS